MAEPRRSDADLLLEGILLWLQADLRWLAACEGNWTGVAGVKGKTPVQRLRGRSAATHSVGWLGPHPAGVPAQHCALVPEYQQLSILRPVAAEHPGCLN